MIKRKLYLIMFCIPLLALSACGSSNSGQPTVSIEQATQPLLLQQIPPDIPEALKVDENMVNIQITAGDKSFNAKLYSNQTAQALVERMPMTLTMDELNGNEKFYYFSDPLPTDSYKPEEVRSGDLMLFGSDCLVLFYESFDTPYSYTKIGFIENVSGLSDALGNRSVQVTFAPE